MFGLKKVREQVAGLRSEFENYSSSLDERINGVIDKRLNALLDWGSDHRRSYDDVDRAANEMWNGGNPGGKKAAEVDFGEGVREKVIIRRSMKARDSVQARLGDYVRERVGALKEEVDAQIAALKGGALDSAAYAAVNRHLSNYRLVSKGNDGDRSVEFPVYLMAWCRERGETDSDYNSSNHQGVELHYIVGTSSRLSGNKKAQRNFLFRSDGAEIANVFPNATNDEMISFSLVNGNERVNKNKPYERLHFTLKVVGHNKVLYDQLAKGNEDFSRDAMANYLMGHIIGVANTDDGSFSREYGLIKKPQHLGGALNTLVNVVAPGNEEVEQFAKEVIAEHPDAAAWMQVPTEQKE